MDERRENIPDWVLERYALGELPRSRQTEILEQLAVDPALGKRLEQLKESDAEILAEYPPDMIAARIRSRVDAGERQTRPVRTRFALFVTGGAAAIALALTLFLVVPSVFRKTVVPGNDEIILIKGETGLKIYRQSNGGYEQISTNTYVRGGERFQIKYNAGNMAYGIIFSIDGRGNLTLHFPSNDKKAPLLDRGGDVALFDAFELDDAPGFERFFFVVSAKPFDVDDVLERADTLAADPKRSRTGSIELGPGYGQMTFTLLKEGAR